MCISLCICVTVVDFHCHYTYGPFQFVTVVLPTVVSGVVIAICNFSSWRNILTMLRNLMPSETNELIRRSTAVGGGGAGAGAGGRATTTTATGAGGAVWVDPGEGGWFSEYRDIFRRLDTPTRLTVVRIMLTPLIYLLFFLATILLYCVEERLVYIITLSLIMLITPLNALLWVVTDVQCMRNYKRLLTEGMYSSGLEEDEDRLSDLADVLGSNASDDAGAGTGAATRVGTSFSISNPMFSHNASPHPQPQAQFQHKPYGGQKHPSDRTELLL